MDRLKILRALATLVEVNVSVQRKKEGEAELRQAALLGDVEGAWGAMKKIREGEGIAERGQRQKVVKK